MYVVQLWNVRGRKLGMTSLIDAQTSEPAARQRAPGISIRSMGYCAQFTDKFHVNHF